MAAITITNAGHNLIRDTLAGVNNGLIRYVALGTSATAPTLSDTQLGAESYRKAVTSLANGASPGELLVNMYLGPSDDVGDAIQEVGFFGGNSATSTRNTGVLLAHGLYNHPKTGAESIQFQLDLVV